MVDQPRVRIGELSRRVGVSPQLLRAWEARYSLLAPARSAGGLRLYSAEDERRVRLMLEQLAQGAPAAEAARVALARERTPAGGHMADAQELARELEAGVAVLDEPRTQAVLDRALEGRPLAQALGDLILPFLRHIGESWAAGEIGVAHEHFASNAIGARLRALARGWGAGVGPRALLACQPGERHDLGLLCFGLALRERGWRIAYLGADTPLADVIGAARELSAAQIKALRKQARVAIGGAGATPPLAAQLGVELLAGDAVSEAAALVP